MSVFKVRAVSGVERRVLKSGAVRGRVRFKVRAVSGVERASAEVTSSDRSCLCLKCDQ